MKTINLDSSVNEAGLLGASEASDLLGVRKETLYAYVSRGLLRSYGGPRSRGSRYLASDVLRLKAKSRARAGHTAVAAGALRWGEPVLDSGVSQIDGEDLFYRGHSAITLARRGATFEAVAELLWTGILPKTPPTWRALSSSWPRERWSIDLERPRDAFVSLWTAASHAALRDGARHDPSRLADLDRARALLPWLANLGPRARHARGTSIAARLAWRLGLAAHARVVRALDQMLVLIADHELNASTFAVRVAASTGADLYACLVAGFAAASGVRHGAASTRVEALVDEIAEPARARRVVEARTQRGERIPGFEHPLYPERGDPRAPVLLSLARSLAPGSRPVRTIIALCREMERSRRERPNVDLGLVAAAHALGAPPAAASLVFALGRTAGWVAHALEQREANFLLRPRARYVGAPHEASGVSLAKRTGTAGDKK